MYKRYLTHWNGSFEVDAGRTEVIMENVLAMKIEESLCNIMDDHPLTRFRK